MVVEKFQRLRKKLLGGSWSFKKNAAASDFCHCYTNLESFHTSS